MVKKTLLLLSISISLLSAAKNDFYNQLEVGLSSIKFDYNEYSKSGSWLDSETSGFGEINGLEASYSHKIADGFSGGNVDHLIFKFSYHKGDTDYKGNLQNLNTGALTPYSTKTQNDIIDTALILQESNIFPTYSTKTSFMVGYRFWQRDSSKDRYGYNEEYKWLYLGLGIGGDYLISQKLSFGFDATYKYAIKPQMYASLAGGLTFDLGTTQGFDVAFPLTYHINENLDLTCKVSYEYWSIKHSNTVSGFYEPESRTKNYKALVGFNYKFGAK